MVYVGYKRQNKFRKIASTQLRTFIKVNNLAGKYIQANLTIVPPKCIWGTNDKISSEGLPALNSGHL